MDERRKDWHELPDRSDASASASYPIVHRPHVPTIDPVTIWGYVLSAIVLVGVGGFAGFAFTFWLLSEHIGAPYGLTLASALTTFTSIGLVCAVFSRHDFRRRYRPPHRELRIWPDRVEADRAGKVTAVLTEAVYRMIVTPSLGDPDGPVRITLHDVEGVTLEADATGDIAAHLEKLLPPETQRSWD